MDPNWYAIWTRSRHEKLVRDQLDKKAVDVFLPTIGKWSRWKDRKKKIDWPLFPGYVFARFVPDERIGILKVDGVVQIISNNGMLSPIPEEEIESIRTLVESELAYDPVPLIKEGDMVRVAHGPLKGRGRPVGSQRRPRASGSVGGFDWTGCVCRSGRGRCKTILNAAVPWS